MTNSDSTVSRPDAELVQRAARFSTATLGEALGKRGDLPPAIKPIALSMRVCGPAVTVSSPPLDNLALHKAIYLAAPGDVLVVEVSGYFEAGYWGEILTQAALCRNIAGLVIDGCVRDSSAIEQTKFPVFSRGLCIRGTTKKGAGRINQPITIGEIRISPGDLVVGDRDGVVVVPQSELAAVLAAAVAREQKEDRVKQQLKSGRTTLEIYGW